MFFCQFDDVVYNERQHRVICSLYCIAFNTVLLSSRYKLVLPHYCNIGGR